MIVVSVTATLCSGTAKCLAFAGTSGGTGAEPHVVSTYVSLNPGARLRTSL